MSGLVFVPWSRAGAAATLNAAAVSAAVNRPRLAVTLAVKSTPAPAGGQPPAVAVDLQMLGPGDVVGIDARQVIRTEPSDGASGVECELFPVVEFDDPSLPWLFSPVVEDTSHRLRPWLCLVVVRDQDGVTLDRGSGRLTIASPANPAAELPNLAETAAWAHVQYAGTLTDSPTAAELADALHADPVASLSRLLSPRQLRPFTRYLACVVPTYALGVQAGLGASPGPDAPLTPAGAASPNAWEFGSSTPVALPVYYSFSFATGEDGDFLSLAQALAHTPDTSLTGPDGLGERTLDLTHVGFSWPTTTAGPPATLPPAPATLPLPSILQPANAPAEPLDPPAVAQGLRAQLTPTLGTAQLRPPVYGAVQGGVRRGDLAGSGPLPTWLTDLNFDPRARVAAGLGAQVVAKEQESLVGAAWDQVEQVREVNALLSRAQLARAVSRRQVTRHLASQDAHALLQITAPQARRAQLRSAAMGSDHIEWSGTPWALVRSASSPPALAATVSGPYRRMTRPRGPHAQHVPTPPPPGVPLTSAQLISALRPGTAVSERVVAERLSPAAAAAARPRPDVLRELSVSVSYGASMVVPLAELAPDAILAGIHAVPPDTALSLRSQPAAIAAYMVGLNSEVSRELLWRGVPTDRRATPFQWFWDTRGQQPTTPDITPIATTWAATDDLVGRVAGGAQQIVLLLRTQLFRRYPNTAVYAVRAQPSGSGHALADETKPENVLPPQFTTSLPPDVRVFGFALPSAEAIGSPGWFFVLQEQNSETRFGCQQQTTASYWSVAELSLTGKVVLPANPNSADVADGVRLTPVRCAIHAGALLPASSSGGSS